MIHSVCIPIFCDLSSVLCACASPALGGSLPYELSDCRSLKHTNGTASQKCVRLTSGSLQRWTQLSAPWKSLHFPHSPFSELPSTPPLPAQHKQCCAIAVRNILRSYRIRIDFFALPRVWGDSLPATKAFLYGVQQWIIVKVSLCRLWITLSWGLLRIYYVNAIYQSLSTDQHNSSRPLSIYIFISSVLNLNT